MADAVTSEAGRQPTGTLRVLVALQYYRPHRTGLTLHVQHLAEELAGRGHSVTVVTARHDDAYPHRARERGVRVDRLWAPIRVSRGMVMPGYPFHLWRALGDCDLVSVHTPLLETALIAVLARARGVPIVITHHGDLVLPPGRLERAIERVVRVTHRVGLRLAATTIAYSDDYRDHSAYIDRSRPVAVITPPIRIPSPDAAGVAAWRRQLAPEGGPLLVYAGRFVREKRPDLAIRALAEVRRTRPSARLVFAGQHDIAYEHTWTDHAALVAAHREALAFVGVVDDPQQLADLYAASDVLVLPSDTECFGLVQVEAMLCGTPVVTTDIPGARVPVRSTGMGRLARAGDAASVAAAIDDVLADPARYTVSPEEVAARLRLDETLDRYEEVFRAAARRGDARPAHAG